MDEKNLQTIIDKLHIEDLYNDIHPSIFDDNDGYDMLIVRLPSIKETLDALSLGFIITPEESFFFNKETLVFEKLKDRFGAMHKKIDHQTDLMLKSFEGYKDHISDMEETLYQDKNIPNFMTQWLGLKRDILRIERILHRTSSTFEMMIAFFEEKEGFPINDYVDLHEHIDRTMRSAVLHLSKLDYIYNFHNARTNEKMNKQIYILTILSGIFLPLNLMVGFFGMNTSGLPFTSGDFGTYNVIAFMSVLTLVTTLLFILWRKKV